MDWLPLRAPVSPRLGVRHVHLQAQRVPSRRCHRKLAKRLEVLIKHTKA